jgi:hypothetical protein
LLYFWRFFGFFIFLAIFLALFRNKTNVQIVTISDRRCKQKSHNQLKSQFVIRQKW